MLQRSPGLLAAHAANFEVTRICVRVCVCFEKLRLSAVWRSNSLDIWLMLLHIMSCSWFAFDLPQVYGLRIAEIKAWAPASLDLAKIVVGAPQLLDLTPALLRRRFDSLRVRGRMLVHLRLGFRYYSEHVRSAGAAEPFALRYASFWQPAVGTSAQIFRICMYMCVHVWLHM